MQHQLSGASPAPLNAPPAPDKLSPQANPPGRAGTSPPRKPWVALILVVLLACAGVGYWVYTSHSQAEQTATTATATRTFTVAAGSLERTIRITGTTAAAKYVSLITPQLRGSRSGRGQSYSGGDVTSPALTIRSNGGSTGFAADAASSGTPTTNANQSGLRGTSNASSALQSATSRVSSSSTSSSSRASSNVASSSSTAGAEGSSGLGSTSSDLGAGMGGGGGGGDFSLVLQKVADPGSLVKKGQVVAEFDRQFMLNRLEDYRSSVNQAEASFKKQKSIVTVTRRNHEQLVDSARADLDKAMLDLKTVPVLSRMSAERARLSVEQAQAQHKQLLTEVPYVLVSEQAQIKISDLSLKQTQIELRRAEANADRMTVKTPIDGLVVMQSTFRGGDMNQIRSGDQLWPGMFFMQIVDTSSMVINATVNQVDVEKIRIGSKAWIRFDAYPDLRLPAHVFSLAAITKPGGMRAAYFKEVAVNLKLDQMDPRVIPDLSVCADVIIETEPTPAPIVALASVFHDASGQSYVWVKKNDSWERRVVELGTANFVSVTVRKGLQAGEVIAAEWPKLGAGKDATPASASVGGNRAGT
jgi:HlyD family secretion protein